MNLYAFPPVAVLGKVVAKSQDYLCSRIIVIAPGWPNMPFKALQPDSSQESVKPKSICLAVKASVIKEQSLRQSGPFLQSFASVIRWTSGHHL